MTQKWRRSRAGSQSESWRAACTTKSVCWLHINLLKRCIFSNLMAEIWQNEPFFLAIFCVRSNLFLCFSAVKYERIKFLVIALKNSVEIYAWAPKPYHKFMAFKVTERFGFWNTDIFALKSINLTRQVRIHGINVRKVIISLD